MQHRGANKCNVLIAASLHAALEQYGELTRRVLINGSVREGELPLTVRAAARTHYPHARPQMRFPTADFRDLVLSDGTPEYTSNEQCIYAIGHACLITEQRITSYDLMGPDLLLAGGIETRSRNNFQRLRQQGLATYVDLSGTPTSDPTPVFTLLPAGWRRFEALRDVRIGVMMELSRNRLRLRGGIST